MGLGEKGDRVQVGSEIAFEENDRTISKIIVGDNNC
jgi:hypothetical protein